MYSRFRSTLIVLAAGLVLAASSILSGAQQPGPLAGATAPAASSPATLPDAPAPQIGLAAADPRSGQAQTVQQPAAGSENLNNGSGQSAAALATQTCTITGTITDVQDEIVPGATVALEGAVPADSRQAVANDSGFFEFKGLKPGIAYHVTVEAKGFVSWKSPALRALSRPV